MGTPDGSVPQAVTDQAKKTAQYLLDHPNELPSPLGQVVTDAKKIPDKIAADLKGAPDGKDAAHHAGDAPGAPGAASKRPGAPHVTGGPDVDPHVKLGDGGKPDLRGTTGGGHVTVSGREGGTAYSATARGAAGEDAKGHAEVKSGVEGSVTIKGGGGANGPPRYSATAKIEGSIDAAKGTPTNEKARGTVQGEVQLGHGFSANAGVTGGVDVNGSHAKPGVAGTVGITFTPGAGPQAPHTAAPSGPAIPQGLSDQSIRDAVDHASGLGPKYGTTPGAPLADARLGAPSLSPATPGPSEGQLLAARIQHDHFLAGSDQVSPSERKMAAARAVAEEKVMSSHPEFGNPTVKLDQMGLKPGEFHVVGKDGVQYSGEAVKLPANLQNEIQGQMNAQNRVDAREIVQERGRGHDRAVAGHGM
jgi:hypothetical protein